ncbi:MAG: permease [Alphaproteobacteria bacterium]|nr:permease [Alphaproteobacteria bacterium]MCB1551537.1 permease [Alphaproteobacteria bacterium]MCB9984548.1 permease [Micavibrio sp.]HRK98423.1 permease [Alphaproteobacteria bacterium]
MLELFTYLADFLTYSVFGLQKETKLADAIHFFVEDTTKIFFLLALMIYIIGFARSYVSPEKVRLWLTGKNRLTGYVLAAMLGAVTPFCSCSSVPLFIGFLSAGIPLGVTMAFLITSPLVNEVAVVLLGNALGLKFTFLYVGTGLSLGVLGGFIIDLFKLDKWVEPYVWQIKMPTPETVEETAGWKWREKLARGEALDIIKRVWLYVLIGVGLGAGLHGFVPREWFLEHAGADNPLGVPLAVLLGIPLYSNATGIIPVAEVLINKGVPVGTILAFLMSIVAISLPELLILRKVLKPQMLIFFVGFLFVAFISVGYLFNFIFGG